MPQCTQRVLPCSPSVPPLQGAAPYYSGPAAQTQPRTRRIPFLALLSQKSHLYTPQGRAGPPGPLAPWPQPGPSSGLPCVLSVAENNGLAAAGLGTPATDPLRRSLHVLECSCLPTTPVRPLHTAAPLHDLGTGLALPATSTPLSATPADSQSQPAGLSKKPHHIDKTTGHAHPSTSGPPAPWFRESWG